MARLARLTVPGYAHHIIQRGNNNQAVFASAGDYRMLLSLLEEHAAQKNVAIHAYVLMSNHFHIVATPETPVGIPQMMQAVGRRYVRYFNQRIARTGTLWEGRYRANLIQAERYLLACMVDFDLIPVRAQMATTAVDYPWSSHRHHVGQASDRLITNHPLYWQLGNTPFSREAAYAELVRSEHGSHAQQMLTESALRGWALGDADFVAALEGSSARRLTKLRAGRPKKRA